MAASSESPLGVFRRSISSILDGWTVLQLAVSHGYGGVHSREKALWMVDVVYNWFQENEGIEPEELQDFIAEILDNEFDTRAEDGSLIVISRVICSNFDLCHSGRHATVVQRIQEMPKASLGFCQAAASQDPEDMEDGEVPPTLHEMMGNMDVGTSGSREPTVNGYQEPSEEQPSRTETQPAEDEEDGWTVVRKNKKK
ncbi:pre-rRNA-processing protein TSR2 homolog isoform X2 [Acanthaster planci]|uniref:Pre-rRNA-processing protein TSR2 homolog n=1 Tax=Acanthaster planci TaxID=133434 RepID=A0A8B7XMW4_ACAPL|nr:pre-rRNA-processing protein TSR2 homolog isoform X2 [Acanthaster planci]